MQTDKEIYLLLRTDDQFLRILCGGLTVAGPYQFDPIDFKALERRLDGVVLPANQQEPIYAIEVQGWCDPGIYARMLIDMGLLMEAHPKREVRGLLLFLIPEHDPQTPPWPDLIERDPDPPIRRVYLIDVLDELRQTDPDHPLLATFLPFLIEDQAQLRTQAPAAYRIIQQAPLPEPVRRQCRDVFQSWIMARFPTLTIEEILTMLGELTPLEQTRAYQDIIARNRPIWIKEGRKEGCQEEANGLIRRQLARRLGSLSAAQEKGLEALTLTQLEALGEALLDFTDAADLDAWLDQELRRA
jgi:predicted transposase YdaD